MQTLGYEVLCVIRDALEQLRRKVERGCGDVPQGLLVRVPTEGREAGEKNIGQYTQRPDVCRQADWVHPKNLRS